MSKDDDKKKNGSSSRAQEHRSGSVVAEDEKLTLWLNQLWARDELPGRIEVWQTFGQNRVTRGEMIFHQDFKTEALDIEQVNKLANEIMEAAQNDCDSLRRASTYQIAIIDHNRKATPLVRRIGPIEPQRSYAISRGGESLDDDGDEPMSAQAISLKTLQLGIEQQQWDKQRNDRVLGEVILLLVNELREVRTDRNGLLQQNMGFFEKLQDSMDRSLDRETAREHAKFKLSMWRDGMRTARNLLPGLFSDGGGKNKNTAPDTKGDAQTIDHGSSPERTLVDNFLTDVEEDDNLTKKLIGVFEEQEGKLVQTEPGIFTINQSATLSGVRNGRLPVIALDNLMPQSGHADEITQEQIQKAVDIGVTEGIGMAIFELVGMRQRAKQAREAQKETT